MTDPVVVPQSPALPCTVIANRPAPDAAPDSTRRKFVSPNCLIVGWESDDDGIYVPIVFGLDTEDWGVRQYAQSLHDSDYTLYSIELAE